MKLTAKSERMEMGEKSLFLNLTQLIAQDKKYLFSTLSFLSVLAIFINLNFAQSPIIGITASAIYFLINATFLGRAFFESEKLFIRFLLGILLLIVLLGLVGLTVMLLYNLDNLRSAITLCIPPFCASLLNRRMKSQNAT